MGKIYTVAVIGCGSRGWQYGNEMFCLKDNFKIVAICDIDENRRKNAQEKWGILSNNVFNNEFDFFSEKRADLLVIATQDRDHVRMCIQAMKLGYDILLEKPISPVLKELKQLLKANKKYNRKVVVCHVLRYAPAYLKIKEEIDKGSIGKIVHIENTEQVDYWHQAHSFVRGNWRKQEETSPMIMQKCCHDFDMIQYLVNSKCKSVYSQGDISYFKKENQPNGASNRCADCVYVTSCPYSAERLYIERWKQIGSPEFGWPFNVVCDIIPNTEEEIRKAYTNNQYGRCVFDCDNDVVDNQSVCMTFINGVKVTHNMSAFTDRMGRHMVIHGTLGEIELIEDLGILNVFVFGQDKKSYSISDLLQNKEDEFNHGGGDSMLVKSFYDVVENNQESSTSLESSLESHLIALSAEKSRKTGKVIYIHKK